MTGVGANRASGPPKSLTLRREGRRCSHRKERAMKRAQKWWTPMLLGAALMAVLVGVAAAVPPEKPSAQNPPRQVVLCAADFYPTRDIVEYWNDGYTLDTMKDNTQYRFLAPVNFVAPYWVTVDKVELFAYDNNTNARIVMDLYRSKPAGGAETLMASIDTGHAFADPINDPRTWQTTTISPNVVNPANDVYIYLLMTDDTALSLYGVRIWYHVGK